MSPKQKRRLSFALAMLLAGGVAAVLVVFALQDNVLFFYSPSDLAAHPPAAGRTIRIGGLVEQGSVKHNGLEVDFTVTDGKHTVPVRYSGVLPDLFREGQGVVALGATDTGGRFVASEILAKHDERYMPREVVDALKRSGRWQEGETTPSPAP